MEGHSDRIPFNRKRSSQSSTPYTPVSPPDESEEYSEEWRDSVPTLGGGYFGNFQPASWNPGSSPNKIDSNELFTSEPDTETTTSHPHISHSSREIPITLQVRSPESTEGLQNVGLNSPTHHRRTSSVSSINKPLPRIPRDEIPADLVPARRQNSQSTYTRTPSLSFRSSTSSPPPIIGTLPGLDFNAETSYQPHKQLSLQPVSYDDSRSDNSRSPLSPASLGRTFLRTVGSFRRGPQRVQTKLNRASQYARISEENERDLGDGGMPKSDFEMEPMDHGAPLGVDVSSFGGPMRLQDVRTPVPGGLEAQVPLTQSNVMESRGVLTGNLGSGMAEVPKATLEIPQIPDTPIGGPMGRWGTIRRSTKGPARATSKREVGLDYAQKVGHMVAVEEVPEFDLSVAEGGQKFGSPDADGESLQSGITQPKKSYYFPMDPDMPNWKPFTMRKLWICFLILLGLTLAGIEEWLCQLSLRRTDAQGRGGLLEFVQPQEVKTIDYFTWKYLPTIVLVSYGIMWQATDFEVKRLEPYYQLSRRKGAKAAESLNIDYLTFWGIFAPFKALRYRQWAVILSSSATLISAGLVPILQSAAVNLEPNVPDRRADEPKYVQIDPGWSRAMEAFLVLVALQGVALLIFLRRKSGLQFDPKGIAGIAAMANRSHILNDFRDLDLAKHSAIHKQLRHRRYILHKSSIWQGEYLRNAKDDDWEDRRADNPHPIMLRLEYGIPYILFIMGILMLVPIFMFTRANVVTEKLPWLLTAIATFIKLVWTTLECDVRMIEPFYILSRRYAPAKTLTLDYTGTIFGWMPLKALSNRHWLLCWVSFATVLTEVLTVCVSSFNVDGSRFISGHGSDGDGGGNYNQTQSRAAPDPTDSQGEYSRANTSETFKTFWVSFALVIGILLILAIIATTIYARRRHAFLPREPSTIASVLAFIHQSKMLYDFTAREGKNIENMDGSEMTRHLELIGKSYGLGWYKGRDGAVHLGIDEEPLIRDYKHGEDIRKAMLVGPMELEQMAFF